MSDGRGGEMKGRGICKLLFWGRCEEAVNLLIIKLSSEQLILGKCCLFC